MLDLDQKAMKVNALLFLHSFQLGFEIFEDEKVESPNPSINSTL